MSTQFNPRRAEGSHTGSTSSRFARRARLCRFTSQDGVVPRRARRGPYLNGWSFALAAALALQGCTDTTSPAATATPPLPALEVTALPPYELQTIPQLPDSLFIYEAVEGGASSEAWGISQRRSGSTVVGFSQRSYLDLSIFRVVPCIGSSAFVRIRGVVYDLFHKRGDPDSCLGQSVATDVNSSDWVTGVILRYTGEKRGFFWAPGRPTPTLLPRAPWGGIDDVALAINKYGLIAGYAESALAIHATLWRGGTPIDIHPAGYGNSRALDLDDDGWVVGVADGIVGYWTPNGRFVPSEFRAGREVNNFFGVFRFPVSISPSGVIAFSSTPPGGGPDEAYVWDIKRGLPPVRQTLAPGGISGINDSLTIAGWEHGFTFGPRKGIVRRDAGLTRLPNAVGSTEAWPQAISECGAIAGVARKPGFNTRIAALWTWPRCP